MNDGCGWSCLALCRQPREPMTTRHKIFWYHTLVSGDAPDERLLEAALAGAPGARRELAARLLDVIQREVAAVLRRCAASQARDPRQEVRDLVQEVLVSLFEHDCRELRRWIRRVGARSIASCG